MEIPIDIVLSGGPFNGTIRSVYDKPEIELPFIESINDYAQGGFKLGPATKIAVYKRTENYDKDNHRIFEFVRIEKPN